MMPANWAPSLSRIARCRSVPVPILRLYSGTPDLRIKDTSPSSSRPSIPRKLGDKEDEGYLAFTNSSLYKLTLPLIPNSASEFSKSFQIIHTRETDNAHPEHQGGGNKKDVEGGENAQTIQNDESEERAEGPKGVIFLLHAGQPLSYIANLIRCEAQRTLDISEGFKHNQRGMIFGSDSMSDLPITFHISSHSNKRWSLATGFGDFLRESARVGRFTIFIGSHEIRIIVPSFEERTSFLRESLNGKTERIQNLTRVKDECDKLARQAAQRVAFAGAGVMGSWWITVGVLTFHTSLGWDTMEPITYLTGFGMVIGSYIWFLWHHREVSYHSVLTETTSRRQQKLYHERGFDIEVYHELIEDAKELRWAIKQVAWDYELAWDQSKTLPCGKFDKALRIIKRDEERDKRRLNMKEREKDSLSQLDDDGDGRPDGR